MAAIDCDEWFPKFAARHLEKIDRQDWPEAGSRFWGPWKSALERQGVTEEVADAASDLVAAAPPQYLDRQLEAFLSAVRRVHAASEVRPAPAPTWDSERSAAWDAAARSKWDRTPEAERERLRALVRERLPRLARSGHLVEQMAIGWGYDPASIVPAPAPETPSSSPGLGRALAEAARPITEPAKEA